MITSGRASVQIVIVSFVFSMLFFLLFDSCFTPTFFCFILLKSFILDQLLAVLCPNSSEAEVDLFFMLVREPPVPE